MKTELYYTDHFLQDNTIDFKAVAVKWHVAGWLFLIALLFAYKQFVVGDTFGSNLDFIFFTSYTIGVFYFNVHILIPLAFREKGKKLHRIILYTSLEMMVLFLLLIGLSVSLGGLEVSFKGSFREVDIVNLAAILLPLYGGVLLSLAYYSVLWGLAQKRTVNRNNQVIAELEQKVATWKFNHVKAKVPTHFLSNALTLMRYNLKNNPKIGEQCVNLLSEILQFYSSSTLNGLITVKDEVEQLERYKRLHEIRVEREVFLEIDVQEDCYSCTVLPMVLLSLAENMYKYSVLTDRNKPARLSVTIKEEALCISAVNWINHDQAIRQSSGFGHEELQLRLAHFYPKAFLFKSERCEHRHVVELQIFDGNAQHLQGYSAEYRASGSFPDFRFL